MSARKDRENWERFRDDWENNRIVVHVDPFKAVNYQIKCKVTE